MNTASSDLSHKMLWLLLGIWLLFGNQAVASPALKLEKSVTPPGTAVAIAGSGFTAKETVTIYFDKNSQGSISTDNSGAFSALLKAPKTALPGTHQVKAYGQNSQTPAQQPLLIRTDWNQHGFDSTHRGQNPYENVLNVNNVGQLDIAWQYSPNTFDNTPSPAVANGLVYVKAGKYLHAYDANSSALKWSRYLGEWGYSGAEPYYSSSAAVADGSVFVASGDGKIYALNALTGAIKWSYATGVDITASLSVAEGIVYAVVSDQPGNSPYLYALDAINGNLKWSWQLPWWTPAAPTVAGGIVYIGCGHLYALNAETGSSLWDYTPANGSSTFSSVSVYGTTVYAYFGNDLYALDAVNGMYKWSYATNSVHSNHNAPPVADGTVLVMGLETIDALNSANGILKWRYDVTAGYNTTIDGSTAALANGVVYVAVGITEWSDSDASGEGYSNKYLLTLNMANGNWLGHINIGGWPRFEGTPVIANGVVYLSDSVRVYALKAVQ